MSNNAKTNWSGYYPEKDSLRAEIWLLVKQQGVSLRELFGHIPNFVGTQKAAERLAALPIWQRAIAIKCNPDSPQILALAHSDENWNMPNLWVPQPIHDSLDCNECSPRAG